MFRFFDVKQKHECSTWPQKVKLSMRVKIDMNLPPVNHAR